MATRDPVVRAVETTVQGWRREAELRRRRTPADPVAEALESAASEVETVIRDAEAASVALTVPEYAHAHGVNEATVRRWIHRGELEAEKNGSGDWMIARTAKRRRHINGPQLRKAG